LINKIDRALRNELWVPYLQIPDSFMRTITLIMQDT